MATKIIVSKQVYNYFNSVCREIAKKLLNSNYTTASLNAAIEAKITQEAFSNMGQRMFEQGIVVETAAVNIIKMLEL